MQYGIMSEPAAAPRCLFEQCDVLLFDPRANSRRQTIHALNTLGFHRILDAQDMAEVEDAANSAKYDLIVADTGGAQSPLCNMIHDLRQNTQPGNPFIGVLLTTWSPTPRNIRRAVNAGSDHVLCQPFSPDQIRARINAVVDDRKPFVVTLEYVGPDRRKAGSRVSEIELIKVPNSLRAKARSDRKAAATPDAVNAAIAQINRQKISRYDLQIGVLIELLSRSYDRREARGSRATQFNNLLNLLDDLVKRIDETGFAQAAPACEAMIPLIYELVTATEPASETIGTLKHIAMTLHICFNPGKTPEEIAFEIETVVGGIESRNHGE